MRSRRLTSLHVKAIEQRWPINPQFRKIIVNRLMRIMADPESSNREVMSAIKGLIAVESQNQKDEHISAIQSDRNRILEFAERLGFVDDPAFITEISAEGIVEGAVELVERQDEAE